MADPEKPSLLEVIRRVEKQSREPSPMPQAQLMPSLLIAADGAVDDPGMTVAPPVTIQRDGRLYVTAGVVNGRVIFAEVTEGELASISAAHGAAPVIRLPESSPPSESVNR